MFLFVPSLLGFVHKWWMVYCFIYLSSLPSTKYCDYHLPLIWPTSLSIISFSSWYSRTSVLLGTATCHNTFLLQRTQSTLYQANTPFQGNKKHERGRQQSPEAASLFQGTQGNRKEDAQRLETCGGSRFYFFSFSPSSSSELSLILKIGFLYNLLTKPFV